LYKASQILEHSNNHDLRNFLKHREKPTVTMVKREKNQLRTQAQGDELFASVPNRGPDDEIAEGDSRIIYDFFPTD
jgi:hypothetical protein